MTDARVLRHGSLPQHFVPRERIGHLLSAHGATVSCLVAPAGYGKSTAVVDWTNSPHVRGRRFATLRLDERDNDPTRFWTRIVEATAALGAQMPEVTQVLIRDEIRSAPNMVPDTTLHNLTRAFEDVAQRGILVLDDLHVVVNPAIREGLRLLLIDLPATVHLVLLSRCAITGIGLHKLRLAGHLQEIGIAELAFTAEESAELLQELTGGALSSDDVDVLIARTEGWVTGLRCAASSLNGAQRLQERRGVSAGVQAFAGHTPEVAEFLLGEVLAREAPSVREFLLDISILEVLSGPVCNAMTQREDSAALLRNLERDGLFVSSFDEARENYRFQPLFREFLADQVRLDAPQRLVAMHSRAARWFAAAGDAQTAIEHGLAAGDHELAASLIAPLVTDLHLRGHDRTIRGWFERIPQAVLAATPQLGVKQAWMLAYSGDPKGAISWCQQADAAAEGSKDQLEVHAESACVRAFAYRIIGDLDATVEWGDVAERLLNERDRTHRHDDSYARLAMIDAVAEAHALSVRPELGISLLRDNLDRIRDGENVFAAVALPGKLGSLLAMFGRLDEATHYVERSLKDAERFGLGGKPPTADAYVGRGGLCWERDDLDASAEAFQAAIDAATKSRRFWSQARAMLGLARCRAAQRKYDEAVTILDAAQRVYPWGTPPDFFQAQLFECRLLLALRQGHVADARQWHTKLAVLPIDPHRLAYLDATTALAERRVKELPELLARLEPPDSTAPNLRWTLELAVLRWRVAAAQSGLRDGDHPDRGSPALRQALLEVLRRGQSGGFVRTVVAVDPGLAQRGLQEVRRLADAGLAPSYLRTLEVAVAGELSDTPGTSGPRAPATPLEPFSPGELAVVRFLPSDLTYAEIAGRRYVSVNTVKSQLKSIYRKLGVTTRAGAAERCRTLGLLP